MAKLTNQNGILYFGSEICREVGVNAFPLLLRHSYQSSTTAYKAEVDQMVKNGIRICRTWGMPGQAGLASRTTGNWDTWGIPAGVPSGNSYTDLSSAWYTKHIEVLDYCASKGLSVIISLIYRLNSLADLKGETLSAAWASSGTATRTFARTIFTNYVNALKSHSAIAAWEICNEWDGFAQLQVFPEDGAGGPRTPSNGAPTYSSPADLVSIGSLVNTFQDLATTIKTADPSRIVMSGNAGPWQTNWYGAKGFAKYLTTLNPDPIDTLSFHMYGTPTNNVFCNDSFAGLKDILQEAKLEGIRQKKPVIIGEIGVLEGSTVDAKKDWSYLEQVLNDPSSPQLMLLWNFGLPTPAGDHPSTSVWDFNEANERAYQLEAIKKVQAKRLPYIQTAQRIPKKVPTKFLRLTGNSLIYRSLPMSFTSSWSLAFWARYGNVRDPNFGRILSTTSDESTNGFAILDLTSSSVLCQEPYLRVFTSGGGLSVTRVNPKMRWSNWRHYGYTFDINDMVYHPFADGYRSRSYYPNGETDFPGSWVAPQGDLVIGGSYTKNSQTWKGDIAHLVMVPRLCSQGEMYEISRGIFPPDAIQLLFDDISGWTQFGTPLWTTGATKPLRI